MKVAKVVDAKEACCVDTLSRPIEEAMTSVESNAVIEVLVRPSFEKMVQRFAQDKGYTILEQVKAENEVQFKIQKTEAERKKENCMVCGQVLEYLTESTSLTCIYCGKQERGYVRCPLGHYVCEVCHGKGALAAKMRW